MALTQVTGSLIANTDYAKFKRDILSGTTTLQDADGNTLSSASSITYVNQLP